jgi:UDP-MurNAc hydroxylase
LVERSLRDLGFTRFVQTRNAEPMTLDGLRVMTTSLVAPADGPLGDSGLSVDDGETRIFDQNDSRPVDFEALKRFGPYDAHFLQFSGAIWYPMVYRFPEKMKHALARKKRENQMTRALRYVNQIGATFVVPHAGPPCFLDPDLFAFNDLERDPTNIFPDQSVFLDFMRANGAVNGHLMIPGSVAAIAPERCDIVHPLADAEVAAIFTDKRRYLEAYQARKLPVVEEAKAAWPRGQVEIVPALRDWFEPLLEQADLTCLGIDGVVLLDCGREVVAIDFQRRRVNEWRGDEWLHRIHVDPALVEYCIVHHVEDWVNELFLSCRFEAERKGKYNEYVYSFFKCLSPERIQYAEGHYAEQSADQHLWESHGYRIQRRCPHLKADLTRFAEIEGGVLTCTLHGWQFDLETGRCLTSDDRSLYTEPIDAPVDARERRARRSS